MMMYPVFRNMKSKRQQQDMTGDVMKEEVRRTLLKRPDAYCIVAVGLFVVLTRCFTFYCLPHSVEHFAIGPHGARSDGD